VFRGKQFNIAIKNGSKGSGVKSLKLNGESISGNLLHQGQFKAENQVEVELA
jgi:hypothetical protein